MNWRHSSGFGALVLLAVLAVTKTGCNYNSDEEVLTTTGVFDPGAAGQVNPTARGNRALSEEEIAQKRAILEGAITLIQTAATNSGGNPFQQATKNLNQYFEGTDPADFALDSATRSYLLQQMPEKVVAGLEVPTFTDRDARHLEDCMLYSSIVSRVAGTGDDLTRVRRVFDWMVRQVQLVPPSRSPRRDSGRHTPAPSTSSCAGWRPKRRGIGPSGAGCSWPSAAS